MTIPGEDIKRAWTLLKDKKKPQAEPHVMACLDAMMNGRPPDPFDAFVFALGVHRAINDEDSTVGAALRKHMGLPERTRGQDPAFNPDNYPLHHLLSELVVELQCGRLIREDALKAFAEMLPGSRASHAKLLDALLAKWAHLPRLSEERNVQ